jgi:serine/threonine protein phosphatase 1
MSLFTEIAVPTGSRIFALGDIHGCIDELKVMVSALEERQGMTSDDTLIFLGDYIDRGPDSKGVVDYILDLKKKYSRTFCLKGNHEQMFLAFLGEQESELDLRSNYLLCGGDNCLASYNIPADLCWYEISKQLPASHLDFFKYLHLGVVTDDYILVHAGVNPLASLEEQEENLMLWIRDEFMLSGHSFEKTVIFGHTPFEEIFLRPPYSIGIDTGLVFGNKLTAINLTELEIVQVVRHTHEIIISQI